VRGMALADPTEQTQVLERVADQVDLPWNVVAHNDPVNLMSYVTRVFQKVFGYSKERARKHMLEVHHRGRSVVWTGMREPAEAYIQKLHGHLILATLERAER
jgi:ATP-dependent Clp protease adaptor protein ClpS